MQPWSSVLLQVLSNHGAQGLSVECAPVSGIGSLHIHLFQLLERRHILGYRRVRGRVEQALALIVVDDVTGKQFACSLIEERRAVMGVSG
ncbi:Uncharacterised protein [Mycobacteroides abscessus subsp. abscessus]|nr:Uncharacterised protein [Mycobacteroides abscessus subsp. abscessus]